MSSKKEKLFSVEIKITCGFSSSNSISEIFTISELIFTSKWEESSSWFKLIGWFSNNNIVDSSSKASAYSIEKSGISLEISNVKLVRLYPPVTILTFIFLTPSDKYIPEVSLFTKFAQN